MRRGIAGEVWAISLFRRAVRAEPTNSEQGEWATHAELRNSDQHSSINFEHTDEDWIILTDVFGRWCWYKGVVAAVDALEVTVLATARMFDSTAEWDIFIATSVGRYSSAGVVYTATRYVTALILSAC